MRFLHTLTELPDQLAERLCHLDPDQEIAFVLADPPDTADPEIHAVARAYIDPNTDSAEYALVVQKALTGQGLGLLLMRRLIDACRARGVHEIWGRRADREPRDAAPVRPPALQARFGIPTIRR